MVHAHKGARAALGIIEGATLGTTRSAQRSARRSARPHLLVAAGLRVWARRAVTSAARLVEELRVAAPLALIVLSRAAPLDTSRKSLQG